MEGSVKLLYTKTTRFKRVLCLGDSAGFCFEKFPAPRPSRVKFAKFSVFHTNFSRAAKRGVSNGGVPDLDLSLPFCPFCPFWDFPDFSGIFPICSGMVQGFSRFVPFLFLGLLRAPTRNSPERVRDTIWTFPEKVGNTRVWKHPGLASLKFWRDIFGFGHPSPGKRSTLKISPTFHAKFHDTFGREKREKMFTPHFCRVAVLRKSIVWRPPLHRKSQDSFLVAPLQDRCFLLSARMQPVIDK